jgi:hypothetical protein
MKPDFIAVVDFIIQKSQVDLFKGYLSFRAGQGGAKAKVGSVAKS